MAFQERHIEHIKARQVSGSTQAVYCQQQGLNAKTFSRWFKTYQLSNQSAKPLLIPVEIKSATATTQATEFLWLRLPKGHALNPLLSNIVLDELDLEPEKRGLEFCRFADDCNCFVKSQKTAERVMAKVSQFIEKKLKLKVNQEKSQVALSDKVKIWGFTVVNGTIEIAHKALQTAIDKVKALTPRGAHKALVPTLDKINQWYGGWSNYTPNGRFFGFHIFENRYNSSFF
ncbi:MAG: reverse transcriptase domain-containing protein [Methylococcales bacterium]|nr:reverse transcriptase domain-containing protein [Methylococcales bacterium]